jgi:hypothetical protein
VIIMTDTVPSPKVEPVAPVEHPGSSPDDQPVADLSKAPLPTERTLRRRRNLAFQATRFVAFNTRIMRMVISGHSHSH